MQHIDKEKLNIINTFINRLLKQQFFAAAEKQNV